MSDPCRGGAGSWSILYRFKHLATGTYLAAAALSTYHASDDVFLKKIGRLSSDISHHLIVTRNTKDINTVFELEQAALIEEGDVYVPSNSYVRQCFKDFHGDFYGYIQYNSTVNDALCLRSSKKPVNIG